MTGLALAASYEPFAPILTPLAPKIAGDWALGLDPSLLMDSAGMPPDPWQAEFLRSDARKIALLCCRQSGKSTSSAALALHQALYRDRSLVLLVSPSLRQSSEIFRKVIEIFRRLDGAPDPTAESALRIEFANGSRIVSLPGSEGTIRGYSGAQLIILDEASRIEDTTVAAVRPMLATTRGRLVALTTPAGQRGWFHETWLKGDDWQKFKIVASQCPRIAADWLEQERRDIGELRYREEYECEFLDNELSVFPSALIERAFSANVVPLWN